MNVREMIFAGLCGLFSISGMVAPASANPPSVEDIVQMEILPGWRDHNGMHVAALRFRLMDGWKTYWRKPGQSGLPPLIDFTESKNLSDVQLHWPVPEVFHTDGMQSIGYKNEVTIPLSLTPKTAGQDILLEGHLRIGVCQDVCVPVDIDVSTKLKASVKKEVRAIKRALQERPDTRKEAGVKNAICRVEPIEDGMRVHVALSMPKVGRDEAVVIETGDPSIWVSDATSKRKGATLHATADLVSGEARPFMINRSDLRMTVLANGRGVDIQGCKGS